MYYLIYPRPHPSFVDIKTAPPAIRLFRAFVGFIPYSAVRYIFSFITRISLQLYFQGGLY
jgi:hypothetical protein